MMGHPAYKSTIIVLLLYGAAASSKWPLERCSTNDPNLNACILKAARSSASNVFKGIPLFKLPPIEPMRLGDTVLHAKKGPVNLEVELKNSMLEGVSNIRIDSATYEKTLHRLNLIGYHKDIKLTARYSMKGKILKIPINSVGTVEIKFQQVVADHEVRFTPRNRASLDAQPKQKSEVAFGLNMKSLDAMRMNLTANGLGSFGNRALNEVMNSNWRILFNALQPSIESWLNGVYTKSMESFFSSFDFDEMLPSRL